MRCIACVLIAVSAVAAEPKVVGPTWDAGKGVWRWEVTSEYQRKANAVEVLVPKSFAGQSAAGKKYRVLYVLPVEVGIGGRYNDGLLAVKAAGAADKYDLICVQMGLDTIPWYGDHASDPAVRQESYLKKVVVPLIEEKYPVLGGREGRWLLGFSKSGWGAFSLILRDPQVWGRAAAWDAPLMLRQWVPAWGMEKVFGTVENFEKYRVETLLRSADEEFKREPRLALLGEMNFGANPKGEAVGKGHTVLAHELMDQLGVRHAYDDNVRVGHAWETGWVERALELVAGMGGGPN